MVTILAILAGALVGGVPAVIAAAITHSEVWFLATGPCMWLGAAYAHKLFPKNHAPSA